MIPPVVVIDPQADQDLDDQFAYIAQDSLDAALRFLQAASDTFDRIAAMPGMGRARSYRNPQLVGVRSWPIRGFERYLIFFRAIPGGVEIIRVLHGARDIERILEGS